MHLIATVIGVAAFISCSAFLFNQTNDLEIFPDDKRYLGAALCLIACANAHVLAYRLVKGLIAALGLLAVSDVNTLSPFIDRWPEDWYEKVTAPPHIPWTKRGNHPMQPSGEIGRFQVEDQPLPPADP